MQEMRVQSLVKEDPLEKGTQPIPVFVPGKFHGPMILADCSPWDPKETDQTEQLTHISKKLTFSSVQSLSRVQLFVTPWTAACQASLSNTNSQSLLQLMSIKLVMPSNHFILCHPLLLLPSIFPSIRVFSNESVLCIRWPKLEFQLQHQSFQWIFRTDFL